MLRHESKVGGWRGETASRAVADQPQSSTVHGIGSTPENRTGTLPEDYFNLAAYYAVGRHPEDNFDLRKALELEHAPSAHVHGLIVAAIDAGCNLCDLDDVYVKEAVEKGQRVLAACKEETDASKLADRVTSIIRVQDQSALAHAILQRPLSDSAIQQLQDEAEAAAEAVEEPPQARAIELMSVVGAKGLSADHVILLGCDNVSLGYLTSKAFFVGLTRARKSLQLLVSVGAGGGTCAHAFITALPERHVRYRKYTQKAGLEDLPTKDTYVRYLASLASARRRGGTQRQN